MTYRERRERRAERRRDWADKRIVKQGQAFDGAQKLADQIPLGQPILVGHHSERHARRDAERIHHGMDRGVEHGRMAEHHARAADTIDRQLDRSIYSDDPDLIDRLTAKLADLTARRDRMKAINRWIETEGGFKPRRLPYPAPETVERAGAAALVACIKALDCTKVERDDLMMAIRMNSVIGYPPYALTNVGASLRKAQQRLDAARQ